MYVPGRVFSWHISFFFFFFFGWRVDLVWFPFDYDIRLPLNSTHKMGAIVIYILLGCICFYVVAIYSNWDIRQIKFTRITLDCYRLYIRLIMTLFKTVHLHFVIQINIYGYSVWIWKKTNLRPSYLENNMLNSFTSNVNAIQEVCKPIFQSSSKKLSTLIEKCIAHLLF